MAQNTTTKKAEQDSFAKELEEALDLETAHFDADSGDLDIAASMEDLEAQISLAAEELAREGRDKETEEDVQADGNTESAEPAEDTPAAQAAANEPGVAYVEKEKLQPAEPVPSSSAPFAPANDDRQRAPSMVSPRLERAAPRTVYWLVAALSVLWIGGAALVGDVLYGPELWQIRSFGDLLSAPYAIGLLIGALVPVILFWGFAVMVSRAQEMRLAAQQMADMALRLAEPEDLAQDRVMMVGQAVRREVQAMGDGIERTLARAVELETLVHTEVNELERAYSENESRIRLLVDSLGSEREGIVSHAERVRASITGAHEILKEELDSAGEQIRLSVDGASQRLTESLSHSGDNLVERINAKGESIHVAMGERADKLSQHISASGDDIANLLDARIATLNGSTDNFLQRLDGSSESVSRILDQRSEELSQRIATSGNAAAELLDTRIGSLGEMFDGRVSSLLSSLGEVSDKVNIEFDTRLGQVESTLSERGRALLDEFSTRAETLDTRIGSLGEMFDGRVSSLLSSLGEASDKVSSEFDTRLGHLESALSERGRALIAEFSTRAEALDTGMQRLDAALEARARGINESLVERTREIADTFAHGREEVSSAIEAGKTAIDNDLSGLVASTSTMLEGKGEEFARLVEEGQSRLNTRLDDSFGRFDAIQVRMDETLDRQIEAFTQSENRLKALLDADLKKLEETHGSFAAALEADIAKIGERREELTAAMRTDIDSVNAAFASHIGVIDERTSTMQKALAVGVDNVRQTLENSAGVLAGTLREKVLDATGALGEESAKILDDVDRRIAGMDTRIASRSQETADTLATRTEALVQTFEEADHRIIARTHQTSAELDARATAIAERLSEIESRLTSTAGSAASAVTSGLVEVEKRLGDSIGRSRAALDEGIGDAEERLKLGAEQAAHHVSQQLSRTQADLVSTADTIGQTFAQVNEHISKRTGETARTLEERTRELNAVLAGRSAEISRILDETARPLVERFEASGGELHESLEAITQRTTERLQEENAALVNALASRTADALDAVERARTNLAGNVDELLQRLNSSGETLGHLVEAAAQNLSKVDERLTDTTREFAASAEKAAETFANSASLINANSGRLTDFSERTLHEISTIASRFEDHGRVLESASNLLEKAQTGLSSSLGERQSALEALANGLVEKSQQIEGAMRSFEGLLDGMLNTAEGRTQKSAEAIRAAVNQVVEAATQRFAGATDDIRRTAAEIRAELEETRADMKRGIVELPEEARQSTSAMRRAITEQVNALKELSDIVAKSGRLHDVAARTNTPEAPPPAAAASGAAPAPTAAPILDKPRPAESARPASPSMQGREAAAQGGWIRDLLRSASREEAKADAREGNAAEGGDRSALHVVESLNSLSVDIARAIDHEASIDLWERYRRGERNVFTRRLYTLKGQQTFDEIQRKYRADAEFRKAVDQYCRDFEKLLADVSRTDRDNMMSQTYLTSDTGKVYTMLAHASGRLR